MLTGADLPCILCHQSLSRVPSLDLQRQSVARSGENGTELQPANVMSLRCSSSNDTAVEQVSILTVKGKHDQTP